MFPFKTSLGVLCIFPTNWMLIVEVSIIKLKQHRKYKSAQALWFSAGFGVLYSGIVYMYTVILLLGFFLERESSLVYIVNHIHLWRTASTHFLLFAQFFSTILIIKYGHNWHRSFANIWRENDISVLKSTTEQGYHRFVMRISTIVSCCKDNRYL